MSQFDDMTLDDAALEEVANTIIFYCNSQRGLIRDYLQKMNSLSSEWRDDETMGKVLSEVHMLAKSVEQIMDTVQFKYPQYFRERAAQIRARPKDVG